MLNSAIFYHQHTRDIVLAFGALFSDIKIARQGKGTDTSVKQTITVPISYSNKEKWLTRIDQDPELKNQVYNILPRMAFEILGMQYDSQRKFNRLSKINCRGENGAATVYSPVPWNIDINLYVLSKTQEDAFQIVEQILPFFAPELTVVINSKVGLNISEEIPIVLNSVDVQDDYEGDFQTRRSVIYTLNFTLKANMYGPTNDQGLIKKVTVNLDEQTGSYNATQATPIADIVEGWTYGG